DSTAKLITRAASGYHAPAGMFARHRTRFTRPIPPLAAPRRDEREGERGFTLIELLVVLAIIGLLVGLVAPAALHQLGSAKGKIAHQSIERLATVPHMYKLDIGSHPS